MAPQEISFAIVSKSSGETYMLAATKTSTGLRFSCSCRAGEMGQSCKHRLSILAGDVSAVPADAHGNAAKLVEWMKGSELEAALRSLADLESAQEAIKRKVAGQKKMVARLLMGG